MVMTGGNQRARRISQSSATFSPTNHTFTVLGMSSNLRRGLRARAMARSIRGVLVSQAYRSEC